MTIVLVHGAWHSPWHWHEVVERLDSTAVTVDLPSCREPYGDLHDDAREIRRVIEQYEDVVLVAHSYGGIPATEAAAGLPTVRQVLYLAAYMADSGETLGGFETTSEPNLHPQTDLEPVDGLVRMRPERAVDVLFHDCPDQSAAVDHLRPMSPTVIGQSPESVAWKEIPSAYAICTRDRATAVGVQRRLASRAGRQYEIESGHAPFLSRPDEVAKIINEVVDEAAGRRSTTVAGHINPQEREG